MRDNGGNGRTFNRSFSCVTWFITRSFKIQKDLVHRTAMRKVFAISTIIQNKDFCPLEAKKLLR